MGDIKLISDAKKSEDNKKVFSTIKFIDGEKLDIKCDFMGQSSEHTSLMMFLNEDEDGHYPIGIVNSDAIKYITIEVKEDVGNVGGE